MRAMKRDAGTERHAVHPRKVHRHSLTQALDHVAVSSHVTGIRNYMWHLQRRHQSHLRNVSLIQNPDSNLSDVKQFPLHRPQPSLCSLHTPSAEWKPQH